MDDIEARMRRLDSVMPIDEEAAVRAYRGWKRRHRIAAVVGSVAILGSAAVVAVAVQGRSEPDEQIVAGDPATAGSTAVPEGGVEQGFDCMRRDELALEVNQPELDGEGRIVLRAGADEQVRLRITASLPPDTASSTVELLVVTDDGKTSAGQFQVERGREEFVAVIPLARLPLNGRLAGQVSRMSGDSECESQEGPAVSVIGEFVVALTDPGATIDGPVLAGAPPAPDSNGEGLASEVIGIVELDGQCLFVNSEPVTGEAVRALAVWPAGSRWDASANTIILGSGGEVEVGATVRGEGGYPRAQSLDSEIREAAVSCVGADGEVALFNPASTVVVE